MKYFKLRLFFTATVYVGYRVQEPDQSAKQQVMIKLQQNNITTQLVEYAINHCQLLDAVVLKTLGLVLNLL
jgi:hypothetical protein